MSNSLSYLYIPIETWSREFHSKLLLALEAVKNDWNVVIGPKTEMQRWFYKLPKGIVLQFGYHKNFFKQYKKLKEYGHKVASIDEEGLVTLNPEFYRRYRVSENTLSECDLCFAWGNKHAEMLKYSQPEIAKKIKIVGNPRIDLCRKELRKPIELDAEAIRGKFGKFILINGNFGSFNHSKGREYTWNSLASKGWLDTPEDRQYHETRIELQGSIFKSFKELIPFLVQNTSLNIVIRPHPSESMIPWLVMSEKYNNRVYVERSGNVLPWIMASEILLHNGCTTAIEAFILNKPAISFRPKKSIDHEAILPHAVSNQAVNRQEVIELIQEIIPLHENNYNERLKYLSDYITSLNGEYSYEKIVNELGKVRKRTNEVIKSFSFDYIINELRHYVAKIIYRKRYDYVLSKCEFLNKEILVREIKKLKLSNHIEQIKISEVCGRLVLLKGI